MTRDTKLALVVGFALVLAVGVLISDHFASGNRGEPEDLTGREAAASIVPLESRSNDLARTREVRSDLDRVGSREEGVTATWETDAPTSVGGSDAGENRMDRVGSDIVVGPEPVTFWQGRSPVGDLGAGGSARGLLPHERDGTDQSGLSGLEPGGATRLGSDGQVVPADARIQTIPLAQLEQTLARNAGRVPPREQSENGRWHVVLEGESLWKIAEMHYGKGSAWDEIARANPDRVDEDGIVRAGVRIRLPEPKTIGLRAWAGSEPGSTSATEKPKATIKPESSKVTPANNPRAKKPGEAGPTSGGSRTYTVRKGETLGQIAQRELGRASRMEEIIRLNTNQIRDADEIRAGMVLRLPK